jgi:DNA-binding winged helix-turn-helix (wHTH) protein
MESKARIVRFGVFEFDQRTGELRKNGAKIKVEGQPIQVLELLLQRPQEVVTQDEIRTRLWPDGTVVEFEHSIKSAVKRLRQALDDDAEAPRYIQTLPRRGYRFIAPVNVEAGFEAGNGRSEGAPTEERPTTESRWGLRAALVCAGLALAMGLAYRFRPFSASAEGAELHPDHSGWKT